MRASIRPGAKQGLRVLPTEAPSPSSTSSSRLSEARTGPSPRGRSFLRERRGTWTSRKTSGLPTTSAATHPTTSSVPSHTRTGPAGSLVSESTHVWCTSPPSERGSTDLPQLRWAPRAVRGVARWARSGPTLTLSPRRRQPEPDTLFWVPHPWTPAGRGRMVEEPHDRGEARSRDDVSFKAGAGEQGGGTHQPQASGAEGRRFESCRGHPPRPGPPRGDRGVVVVGPAPACLSRAGTTPDAAGAVTSRPPSRASVAW